MSVVCLTEEEQRIMYAILKCCLCDLRMDIAKTECMEYRQRFIEREHVLIDMMEKLGAGVEEALEEVV